MRTRNIPVREVYVWQLPVRIFHWVNALCIVILCITGYVIGNPPAIMQSVPPSDSYWFGIVRTIHFITAYVFIVNFLFRVYWAFVGNRFARWCNYIPLKASQRRGIIETIKVDVLLSTDKPIYDIGHNSLAAFTYFFVFLAFLVQLFTGFAMLSEESNSPILHLFKWVIPTLNGFAVVRDVHHWAMWFFILFAIIHIYLVFYHDYIERNGIASSIIGGWKFIQVPLVEQYRKVLAKENELSALKREYREKRKKERKHS